MKTLVLAGFLVLTIGGLQAESVDQPSRPSSQAWLGLSVLDAALCYRLIWDAGWVELRRPDAPIKVIWVHDVRGVKLANGYYGLKINDQVLDPGTLWIEYGQRLMNLQVLFTHGSAPVAPNLMYQDPQP